jgi:hypothetical protein
MERREFLWILGGGVVAFEIGCHSRHGLPGTPADALGGTDTTDERPDAAAEGCQQAFIRIADTYAPAVYLDGSLVLAGTTITLDVRHGGIVHRYTLASREFEALEQGEPITLPTITVGDRRHTLVIAPRYRVPGKKYVVTVEPCV